MILEAFKTEKEKNRARKIKSIERMTETILSSFPMKIIYAVALIALLTTVDTEKTKENPIDYKIEQRQ
jgi:hypothetical protein